MIDWDKEPVTEPPLTMDLEIVELIATHGAPLLLPPYPSNTQQTERIICVLTEVAPNRVGFMSRESQIHQLLESRAQVPSFNTKKDAAKLTV